MSMPRVRRSAGLVALALALAALAPTAPALAWWRGGVFVGVAPYGYYAPRYYYPPVVVAPPVYVPAYPAPAYAPPPYGQACYATPYVCPIPTALPRGSACSCPAEGGARIGGSVG